jgi:hypothetical protein
MRSCATDGTVDGGGGCDSCPAGGRGVHGRAPGWLAPHRTLCKTDKSMALPRVCALHALARESCPAQILRARRAAPLTPPPLFQRGPKGSPRARRAVQVLRRAPSFRHTLPFGGRPSLPAVGQNRDDAARRRAARGWQPACRCSARGRSAAAAASSRHGGCAPGRSCRHSVPGRRARCFGRQRRGWLSACGVCALRAHKMLSSRAQGATATATASSTAGSRCTRPASGTPTWRRACRR